MTAQSLPSQQKNPVEILQEQVIRLTDIYQAQQEQLHLLRSQNEQLGQMLQAMIKQPSQPDLMHVKIEDVNMPFWAMVGFLFKMTFAWIPVGIVLGFIYAFIMAGLTSSALR